MSSPDGTTIPAQRGSAGSASYENPRARRGGSSLVSGPDFSRAARRLIPSGGLQPLQWLKPNILQILVRHDFSRAVSVPPLAAVILSEVRRSRTQSKDLQFLSGP